MATITFKCPTCWTEYKVDAKLKKVVDRQIELGYCKFCRRKDPKVPTTAEMDKLFTVEDMRNRFFVMLQCISCAKWSKRRLDDRGRCPLCNSKFDGASIKSLRSFNPVVDSKRKPNKK